MIRVRVKARKVDRKVFRALDAELAVIEGATGRTRKFSGFVIVTFI